MQEIVWGRLQGHYRKKAFRMKEHQHAVEESCRHCKYHGLRYVWLVKAWDSLQAFLLLFHMPGEAQIGVYGSKCDKQACVGSKARLGGWPWTLQMASLSPRLFWNCLLICGTLHTKLTLKPRPSILTFKALHQVTQGHPSFLMKAGVDLILDLVCP